MKAPRKHVVAAGRGSPLDQRLRRSSRTRQLLVHGVGLDVLVVVAAVLSRASPAAQASAIQLDGDELIASNFAGAPSPHPSADGAGRGVASRCSGPRLDRRLVDVHAVVGSRPTGAHAAWRQVRVLALRPPPAVLVVLQQPPAPPAAGPVSHGIARAPGSASCSGRPTALAAVEDLLDGRRQRTVDDTDAPSCSRPGDHRRRGRRGRRRTGKRTRSRSSARPRGRPAPPAARVPLGPT